jgi:molecular chaperone GrpE (heat shock protein)
MDDRTDPRSREDHQDDDAQDTEASPPAENQKVEDDLSGLDCNPLTGLGALRTGLECGARSAGALNPTLKALRQELGEMRNEISRLGREHSQLVSTQKNIQKLGEQAHEERTVDPMLRQLFPIFDLALGAVGHAGDSRQHECCCDTLRAVTSMLEDFFGVYGVEYFIPKKGGELNSKTMKAVKAVRTKDASRHMRVETCHSAGFRKTKDGTVMRPANVTVWKRAQAAPPQSKDHSTERK